MIEVRIASNTVLNAVRANYVLNLNELSEFEIVIDGANSSDFTNYVEGASVEFYHNSVLGLKATIKNIVYAEGGAIVLRGIGVEKELVNTHLTNATYTATASATIFGTLIGTSSVWTAGTINTGTTLDFRTRDSMTVWQGIKSLIDHTGQDIVLDYSALTVSILNSAGSSTGLIFNEGFEVRKVRYELGEPPARKVIVYGKGDGSFQAKATATSGSYVAGDNVKAITDNNIISNSQALIRANAELSLLENQTKVYTFDVLNTLQTYSLGDTFTLNAPSVNISSDSVRIVSIQRGFSGEEEYVRLEVTNTAYSKKSKSVEKKRQQIADQVTETNTAMVGNGNLFQQGFAINAKNGYPLDLRFNVTNKILYDEAGNKRVTGMTLDYDVDPYNKQYGLASFDGTDPPVSNISAEDDVPLSGAVSFNNDYGTDDDDVYGYLSTVTHGSWTNVVTFNNVTGDITSFDITLIPDNAGEDYELRVYNNDSGYYYPSSSGVYVTSANAGDFIHITIDVTDVIALDDLILQARNTDGFDAYVLFHSIGSHTHADNLSGDLHDHDAGGYKIAANDLDNISINDDVDQSVSVNATEIDSIILQHYNGSSWDNKYAISNTGKTLDTNVDMSDGGTYPDAVGLWRVLVNTNSASPDFVQAIITITHNLDN